MPQLYNDTRIQIEYDPVLNKIELDTSGVGAYSIVALSAYYPSTVVDAIWVNASTGNDSNAGTYASPKATILAAASACIVSAPSVVVYGNDSYREDLGTITNIYFQGLYFETGSLPQISTRYNGALTDSNAVYISKLTGSDSNAGTRAAPFATLVKGQTSTTGAKTTVVILDSETYYENVTFSSTFQTVCSDEFCEPTIIYTNVVQSDNLIANSSEDKSSVKYILTERGHMIKCWLSSGLKFAGYGIDGGLIISETLVTAAAEIQYEAIPINDTQFVFLYYVDSGASLHYAVMDVYTGASIKAGSNFVASETYMNPAYGFSACKVSDLYINVIWGGYYEYGGGPGQIYAIHEWNGHSRLISTWATVHTDVTLDTITYLKSENGTPNFPYPIPTTLSQTVSADSNGILHWFYGSYTTGTVLYRQMNYLFDAVRTVFTGYDLNGSHSASDTTIAINGGPTGGSVLVGDIVTFEGYPGQYRVTGGITGTSGTITITPGLAYTIGSGQEMYISKSVHLDTYTTNVPRASCVDSFNNLYLYRDRNTTYNEFVYVTPSVTTPTVTGIMYSVTTSGVPSSVYMSNILSRNFMIYGSSFNASVSRVDVRCYTPVWAKSSISECFIKGIKFDGTYYATHPISVVHSVNAFTLDHSEVSNNLVLKHTDSDKLTIKNSIVLCSIDVISNKCAITDSVIAYGKNAAITIRGYAVTLADIIVEHCSILNNAGGIRLIANVGTNEVIKNNIIRGNGFGCYSDVTLALTYCVNSDVNIVATNGTGCLNVNPLFVNEGAVDIADIDLHLRTRLMGFPVDSPAIGVSDDDRNCGAYDTVVIGENTRYTNVYIKKPEIIPVRREFANAVNVGMSDGSMDSYKSGQTEIIELKWKGVYNTEYDYIDDIMCKDSKILRICFEPDTNPTVWYTYTVLRNNWNASAASTVLDEFGKTDVSIKLARKYVR